MSADLSTTQPLFSIIIYTSSLNSHVQLERLQTLLEELFQQDALALAEVIVAEDVKEAETHRRKASKELSTQQQALFERKGFHYLKCLNAGPGLCRNRGAEKAAGDYLIFLDTHCILPPDWLSKLQHHIKERPSVDVFYGPIASNSPPIYPFIYSYQLEDEPVRNINIAFKRNCFETLDGYDPNLSYWSSEWDLMERLHLNDFQSVFISDWSLTYQPEYRSPQYFNFSKLIRMTERTGYLLKKHPDSDEITSNFLLFRFQWIHCFIRILPLLSLVWFRPAKVFLLLLFFNLTYDTCRLLLLQLRLLRHHFQIRKRDAIQYLLYNWSLDCGLLIRQLLLLPYRFGA